MSNVKAVGLCAFVEFVDLSKLRNSKIYSPYMTADNEFFPTFSIPAMLSL